MAALNEIQADCHLWLAFQPNTLKDFYVDFPKEWPQMISDMRSRLENHFYVPILSHNLRNASEVFTMTETIKSEEKGMDIKDSLGVTTVAMTIHATTPKLIPILLEERDKDLVDAILFAVERTRDETGDPSSSFVILHDEFFETDYIFNLIRSKKKQEDKIFKYPPNEKDLSPSLDYLDDILENNVQGFLVLKDKGFKGSESQNMILLISCGGANSSDMRCNLLRCISNLSIIQLIDEKEVYKFDKVRFFDNFMSCYKNCKEFIHLCKTCVKEQENELGEQNKKNVFICLSCKIRKSCHPIHHELKKLELEKDLKTRQVKCGCHCNM